MIRSSRLSARHKRIGIAVGAVVFVALLVEALLRSFPAISPEVWALDRMRRNTWDGHPTMREIARQESLASMPLVPDTEIGTLLAPNLHLTRETLDFTYTLRTDSFGFTNREPWPEAIDVAVLGNSLILGAGVGLEGQFATLLEKRFVGRRFLTLGNPGGSAETEYRIYTRYAQPRRPKLVLATMWIVWDVSNAVKFAQWQTEAPSQNFAEYRRGLGPVLSDPAKDGPATRGSVATLFWRSALVRSGYLSAKSLLQHHPYPVQMSFPSGEVVNLSLREQANLVRGIAAPKLPDAGELLMAPLERLRARVEADGGKMLVVLVPSREELYGAAAVPALLNSIREAKTLLAARRLPVLDLYPLFRDRGRERAPFFQRDMHLNAFGHQLVAEGIGGWIAEAEIFGDARDDEGAVTPTTFVSGR